MKKEYRKPFLYAESYELAEHIAGDCAVNDDFQGAQHRAPKDCAYVDSNLVLYLDPAKNCETFWFTNAGLEPSVENLPLIGIKCYNSFLITGNLFAS